MRWGHFFQTKLVALPVHAAWARFLVVTDRRSGLARAAKKWPRLRAILFSRPSSGDV